MFLSYKAYLSSNCRKSEAAFRLGPARMPRLQYDGYYLTKHSLKSFEVEVVRRKGDCFSAGDVSTIQKIINVKIKN